MDNFKHFLASTAIVALSACGGGGGSAGSTINYSGLTSQASLTQGNGETIALGAYQNGALGSQAAGATAALRTAGGAAGGPRAVTAAEALRGAVEDAYGSSEWTASTSRQVFNDTIPGDCGGTAQYSISVNEATGEFSGSFQFNAFCSGDVTLNGTARYSGKVDTSGGTLLEFSFSMQSLSVQACGDAFTMAGTLHYVMSGMTVNGTMNMRIRDDTTGKVYKLENYVVSLTDNGVYTEATVTGRYYDPHHGYVTLTTTTPLRTELGAVWPSAGVVVLTGDSSKARLTADPNGYIVDVDIGNNGTYEHTTGLKSWPAGAGCLGA